MFPVRKEPAAPVPVLLSGPQLLGGIGAIDQRVFDLERELTEAADSDIVDFTRAFVALRDIRDRLDNVNKRVSKLYEDWKTTKVPGKYEQAGVPHINLDEGFRVGVSHRVFASIKKDQKEAAYQWLREHQLADLVTETVNSSTLSAVAKSMAEENLELDPELFSVAVVPNTSVVKTK